MKKRIRTILLLAGIVSAVSFAGACGDAKAPDPGEQPPDVTAQNPDDQVDANAGDPGGAGADGTGNGSDAEQGNGDAAGGLDAAQGNGDAAGGSDAEQGNGDAAGGSDAARGNASSSGTVPDTWDDSDPDFMGDIRDLRDGQFTIAELVTEDLEGGGEVLIGPAGGGDGSDFNKIQITYDDNTRFILKTIYDGGARYDIADADAKDLAVEQIVHIWGSSAGDGVKASQICIVKVGN